MPKGIAINIGLNFVDPAAYGGWDGELAGCINDARDMNRIATGLGYTATMLTDSQASAAEVTRVIGQAARELVSGDICLLTYSGHGSQINDVTGDEPDSKDETWVLWDRQLLDDELNGLWSNFAAGVRIFVLSDSCHSGTVARMTSFKRKFRSSEFASQYERPVNDAPRIRAADPAAVLANYQANRTDYEVSQWTHRAAVDASVILISGCQDNQLSSDGDANGLFTQRLKEVWNSGSFSGNYAQFHSAIVARMPSDQTPNLFRTGVANPAFDAQKPFTIGGTTSDGRHVHLGPVVVYERRDAHHVFGLRPLRPFLCGGNRHRCKPVQQRRQRLAAQRQQLLRLVESKTVPAGRLVHDARGRLEPPAPGRFAALLSALVYGELDRLGQPAGERERQQRLGRAQRHLDHADADGRRRFALHHRPQLPSRRRRGPALPGQPRRRPLLRRRSIYELLVLHAAV